MTGSAPVEAGSIPAVTAINPSHAGDAGLVTGTQRKERRREKLNYPTAEVTNPDGGRQSMVEADRSFSVVMNPQADAVLGLPNYPSVERQYKR